MAVGKNPKIRRRLLGNLPALSIANSHMMVSHTKNNSEKFYIV